MHSDRIPIRVQFDREDDKETDESREPRQTLDIRRMRVTKELLDKYCYTGDLKVADTNELDLKGDVDIPWSAGDD